MNNLRTLITSVIVALFAATAANGAFWQWSKISANNATADATINWAEGMSPSSVNDSARAMMSRAAEYRDDISGSLTTGGTATAFTLTTNQGLAATPTDGQMIAFTPHATSGVAPTLTADGGTAFAIQTSPGVAITNASLVLGTPYSAKFSLANSAWIMRNFYGTPFVVPIGGMIPYTGSTAPNSSFVLPYGQCISRTTYATYFAQVSTTFGACDGVTTFGVPDVRGRVIAGLGNMGGSDAARLTATYFGASGTTLGSTGGLESQTLTTAQMPSHTHTATVTDPGHTHLENVTDNGGAAQFSVGRAGNGSPTPAAAPYVTGSSTTGVTVANSNTGGGTAHPIVQPTIVLTYILRVL